MSVVQQRGMQAHQALSNGKLDYFQRRGLLETTVKEARVGYEAGAFLYPCRAKNGDLLGVHHKGERRDERGKRRQWWGSYSPELPLKANGKPAKVIPWGLETLRSLEAGCLVILCCGEEDALSLRQADYTALSQPGAGLLEPTYARELAGYEVVVFYDAGEESEARRDALTLLEAGAASARVVVWPPDAPHGADVNARLVEGHAAGFEEWAARMVETARPPSDAATDLGRKGVPNAYTENTGNGPRRWPELAPQALYGLPGEVVRAVEPHTEADPAAVLANMLCAFGNAVGRGTHFRVGADRHYLNLCVGLVGETSKGRKGTSWGYPRELMRCVDEGWVEERVQNGLSSGEGLIHAVRDPIVVTDKDGETVTADEGAQDKRMLVVEGEFASVLKVMSRQGNTLSPVVRHAWDGGRLQVLTRNSPLKATGAHVSIIGHVTKAELLRHLTETETANGFANRFIWLMVRRSKVLPFGGEWHTVDVAPIVRRLGTALEFGKDVGEIEWGESAKGLWRERYANLSGGEPGLFGAVVSRAEAQVLRLATLYAVMDTSRTIERPHLEAALALWDYAQESARFIFGDATGDTVADKIAEALQLAPEGLTRNQVRDLFSRHVGSERIGRALGDLEKLGRARRKSQVTGGRPAERWFAK